MGDRRKQKRVIKIKTTSGHRKTKQYRGCVHITTFITHEHCPPTLLLNQSYESLIPKPCIQNSNFSFGRGFVNASTNISFVFKYFSTITPAWTCSLTK
jgi:hypothetical protein